MNTETWKLAWKMLSRRERKQAMAVLAISILGGGAQVLMIGAIFPFLNFISDANALEQSSLLRAFQGLFGLEDKYQLALALGGTAIFAILVSNLVLFVRSYMIFRFTVMRIHSISMKLLRSYLRRPYDFFLGRDSADISKRVLAETSEISNSFLQPAAELIASAISSLCILAFLLFMEPMGTLIGGAVVATLYLSIHRFSGRFLSRLGAERVAANKVRFTAISETFRGIKDVKVHSKEYVYLGRFEAASLSMLQANWKARIAAEAPRFVIQALFFSAIILSCIVMIDPAIFREHGEAVSGMIPVLGVFAFAGQRIVPEIQKIYAAGSRITFGAAALKNVEEDLTSAPAAPVRAQAQIPFETDLVFDRVSYLYPGSSAGIRNISLSIRPGQRIGVVGATGGGKSTFMDLTLGLLKPQSGAILSDGQDINSDPSSAGWMEHVSYVPQSIFIANASIAENIAFGEEPHKIDMNKVERCARAACIHEFVSTETSEGYATHVGEQGAKLSGGQRQRIGIARALYRGAKLLLLDEATSALDPITEREVMKAIGEMSSQVTMIMIAHRLDTLRFCDRLLVLDKGVLVEDGSWDDLLAAKGAFARIAAAPA